MSKVEKPMTSIKEFTLLNEKDSAGRYFKR